MEHGRSSDKPMRIPTCLCGAVGERSPYWDAYYCQVSGVWLEKQCDDPECIYCVERPARLVLDTTGTVRECT